MIDVERWLAPSARNRSRLSSDWAALSPARNDWVKVRGEHKSPQSPPVSARRSQISPLNELLTCDEASLPEVGTRVVACLERLGDTKSLALNWLAQKLLIDPSEPTPIGEHNRVAVIELLGRNQVAVSSTLVLQYLKLPLRAYHLFIVPLARIPGLLSGDDIREVVAQMVRLLGEASSDLEAAGWQGALVVEVFRVASEISPQDVMGQMAGGLRKASDLELTAVLESVSMASQKVSAATLHSAAVRAPLHEIWNCYVENKDVKAIRNRPGIMARLMEVLSRCGEPTDKLMGELNGHPLMDQVLYQFVQRHLDFLPTGQKLQVYTKALRMMVDNNQMVAAQRFMKDVFFPSLGTDVVKSIFQKIGTAAEEVR